MSTLYEDMKRWHYRRLYVFTTLVLALIGFAMLTIQNKRRDAARESFETVQAFDLIILREKDAKLAESVSAEANPNTEAVLTITEKHGTRSYHPAARGCKFVEVAKFGGKTTRTPVYAMFRSPDAIEKMRQWLRDNKYSHAEAPLKWGNTKKEWTNDFFPEKGDSLISVTAYYEAGGRLYMWSGSKVYDMSEGFTGRGIKDNEENVRRDIKELSKLAE